MVHPNPVNRHSSFLPYWLISRSEPKKMSFWCVFDKWTMNDEFDIDHFVLEVDSWWPQGIFYFWYCKKLPRRWFLWILWVTYTKSSKIRCCKILELPVIMVNEKAPLLFSSDKVFLTFSMASLCLIRWRSIVFMKINLGE